MVFIREVAKIDVYICDILRSQDINCEEMGSAAVYTPLAQTPTLSMPSRFLFMEL